MKVHLARAYELQRALNTQSNSHNRLKNHALINAKLIEGVFAPMQKQDMVRKLTDTMVSIEGENMRPVTWVVVEGVKSGDWGVGGNPLTTSDVKARAAGKSKG